MDKDYYKILEVNETASQEEIAKAFKQKARKLHPDVNHADDAKERFQELNEAYETLSDPKKREEYDTMRKYGSSGFGPGMGGGTARGWTDENGNMHWEFSGDPREFDGFGSPFMGGFGMGGFNPFGRRRVDPNAPRRGEDLIFTLSVDFMDAINGCKKKVRLNVEDNCGCLNGCDKCNHTGRVPKTITLEVKVPRGCPHGQRLRVGGQGNRGYNGGPNGDIYFQISVGEHDTFVRDGFDLLEKVDVPFETFILGGTIKVKTLDGEMDYEVKPNTKLSKVVVFRGKGVPVMNSINSVGDLKVLLDPCLPEYLTDEERKRLESYRDERRRNGK